jgi:tRNA (adenine-N(1)-)-methyltransferase non-catalytic subunit
MLNMANIRPGGRYIAVDDASGLVVSGILDRMGGKAAHPFL